jgi:hypothetical protein
VVAAAVPQLGAASSSSVWMNPYERPIDSARLRMDSPAW